MVTTPAATTSIEASAARQNALNQRLRSALCLGKVFLSLWNVVLKGKQSKDAGMRKRRGVGRALTTGAAKHLMKRLLINLKNRIP